jgi:hypothetical protein
MSRFLFTPSDYSPTYDVESDGQRGFVKLHAVWDIPPGYPEARQLPIAQHFIDYMSGAGWAKVLSHRDSLKLET